MKKFSTIRLFSLSVFFMALIPVCNVLAEGYEDWTYMRTIIPESYLCYRTEGAIEIDGKLDDPAWKNAPWTNYFVDIEGERKPLPALKTRAKMLWDDYYFYFAADMEEPHVWGTLAFHDQVICDQNDFEIFIDPDGDTHEYYEIEIGPLNTIWDLFLVKAYKDMNGLTADCSWNVTGMKTAVHVNGTINDPRDIDHSWSVEFAIPWTVLAEFANKPSPPNHGDQWRVNFSRVEYQFDIVTAELTPSDVSNNAYAKIKDIPCDNWVWSPQGIINMHCPEKWGYVKFSKQPPGSDEFVPDPTLAARNVLLDIYWSQYDYFKEHKKYAKDFKELNLDFSGVDKIKSPPAMIITNEGFRADVDIEIPDGSVKHLFILQDSKLVEE